HLLKPELGVLPEIAASSSLQVAKLSIQEWALHEAEGRPHAQWRAQRQRSHLYGCAWSTVLSFFERGLPNPLVSSAHDEIFDRDKCWILSARVRCPSLLRLP